MTNLWRVRTVGSGPAGAPYLNTFWFDASSAQTAQHAADAAHNFWEGVKSVMSNTVTMAVQSDVYAVDSTTGHPTGVTGVTPGSTTGTLTDGVAPLATQGRVDWHSGIFVAGREQRGRTFVPGVCYTVVSSGVPTTSYKTTLTSAIAALLGTTGANLGIYSPKHHLFTYVSLGKVWPNFAVLRSRRD